jgi:hypothetical protein
MRIILLSEIEVVQQKIQQQVKEHQKQVQYQL